MFCEVLTICCCSSQTNKQSELKVEKSIIHIRREREKSRNEHTHTHTKRTFLCYNKVIAQFESEALEERIIEASFHKC
jgi:hypothetical protein